LLDSRNESVLHGFFGKLEISQQANQRRLNAPGVNTI